MYDKMRQTSNLYMLKTFLNSHKQLCPHSICAKHGDDTATSTGPRKPFMALNTAADKVPPLPRYAATAGLVSRQSRHPSATQMAFAQLHNN